MWWDASDGWPAISKANAHSPARKPGVYGKLPGGVLSLAFGPQGELASAGRDRIVRWWNADGGQLKEYPVADSLVTQVAVSFDGRVLAAGDANGQLHFWTP